MFVHPNVLNLLLIIPVAMLFFFWRSRARAAAMRQIGDNSLVRVLAEQVDPVRRRWKSALWLATVALLLIALARPVWGVQEDMIEAEGIAVLVVLDVSNSMNAQDILPSRLDRAKLTTRELFERGWGNEMGLVLFAGSAFVQFPLTTDVNSAIAFLNAASTDSISRQGTALEEALREAIDAMDQRNAAGSVIVLMTDGESHEGQPLRAAEFAADQGIVIHVIGYGSPEGAPIPVYDVSGTLIGHKSDRAGNVVVSRLDESVLEQIAETTGGTYQRASDTGIEAVNLLNTIGDMERNRLQSRTQTRDIERFGLFVALAVVALTAEMFVPETRRDSA